MRRAQDCDWTIVARGELGGSVVRLAEAVIQSPPATEHGARDRLPARHGVAWAPGLTPDHTRELVAVSNARATLPRGAFAIRSQSISELTA
jgi:hypothetical protein